LTSRRLNVFLIPRVLLLWITICWVQLSTLTSIQVHIQNEWLFIKRTNGDWFYAWLAREQSINSLKKTWSFNDGQLAAIKFGSTSLLNDTCICDFEAIIALIMALYFFPTIYFDWRHIICNLILLKVICFIIRIYSL